MRNISCSLIYSKQYLQKGGVFLKQVDSKTLRIRNSNQIITTLIWIAVIGVLWWFLRKYPYVQTTCVVICLLVIAQMIYGFIDIRKSYLVQWAILEEQALRIYRPGFSTEEHTIPLHKVQHVDIQQGIVSRRYGLYRLNIYTAGDQHSISYIPKQEADELRDHLLGGRTA